MSIERTRHDDVAKTIYYKETEGKMVPLWEQLSLQERDFYRALAQVQIEARSSNRQEVTLSK